MSEPRWSEASGGGRYLRPYAITGGRTRHSQHAFTLITQIVSRSVADTDQEAVAPEAAKILELCRDRAVAIAEIAALIDLPVSVVKILCGDLLNTSLILVQSPPGKESQPDVELIERVMDAIRQL
ncbi:DUF742 domain-containing protein [Streptomyces acidiscabies]|uniref:DUF742 domain-containing protein n=1 Tax=Streptomyces acidiscabies TaxID=42234 RepID=A0A0L0JTN7_9ACTN|nr:DUF742 domain-containing protein [Streptomyces acidiscabies]KND28941.1 hypothetical protein IQ63_32410 [Streptomyces acidiscabies]MBZ3917571.1 DUF742 domain-containing protein [Streptomyces acidiscabies]MDX2962742.1 DUF742 domain-containing protein [Streptomyces acidiscabies]MDX3018951.1 DUF742 domain-containing protein [Streptomyces acidiscabies]MDX3790377.1 DUF742 domain-containing protein [Streptomyces acidiscabies]